MKTCAWENRIEAWFDQEDGDAATIEAHLGQCAICAAYLQQLQVIRQHTEVLREVRPIEDAQFNAFMAGIREEIQAPARGMRSVWALVSLVAAALIVALSLFSMFTGPAPVRATDVESISTDLEGFTVNVNKTDDITTIAITPPQRYTEDIQ